jgi:hypothetical protein
LDHGKTTLFAEDKKVNSHRCFSSHYIFSVVSLILSIFILDTYRSFEEEEMHSQMSRFSDNLDIAIRELNELSMIIRSGMTRPGTVKAHIRIFQERE